jgi:nucleoside-diphosphate-sugar epimerase
LNPEPFFRLLDLIISGKTRLKLLLKFFLAPEISGHLRGLADEFGESTNAIRLELNRFEQGGLLLSCMEQNRKGDMPHSLASIEKARKALGYEPQYKFEKGLELAVEWYWNNLIVNC